MVPLSIGKGATSPRRARSSLSPLMVAAMTSKSKSLIFYEGPSVYDGAPIVSIATFKSKNRKTGLMVQIWIMRADVEPHAAQRDGDDASVCGACPLRPLSVKLAKLEGEMRAQCYVVVIQAPLSVYRAYKRGSYAYATPEQMRERLQGGMARLGAYGDPASVPFHVWQRMGVGTGEFGHTGYTHGWLQPASFDKRILGITMLSVDPVSERDDAPLLRNAARWRDRMPRVARRPMRGLRIVRWY
jgi:hypothetical protein